MVSGMISTDSVRPQFEKSGSKLRVEGSILATSPARPPTSGWDNATYAAAMTPTMAIANWMRSDAITPHRPAIAEKTTQITPQTITVCSLLHPSITLAILTAANVTEAMMAQLKNKPRYTARKPRTKAADRPE